MKYTNKALAVARKNALSGMHNYENAVDIYLKQQYIADCKTKEANVFNNTLKGMVKDGFNQQVLDLYALVTKYFKGVMPKDLNKFENMNLWALNNPKDKKDTKVEFGYSHLMKALCSLMSKAKKSRSKGARQEQQCLALLIKTTKQFSAK